MKTVIDRYDTQPHGAALVFTNTERSSLMCPRFWAFQYVQNINSDNRATALSYGSIVHRYLEEILREVMATGALPSLEGLRATHRAKTPLFIAEEASGTSSDLDQDDIMANIEKSFIGWRALWADLLRDWEVIGVELEMAAPVKDRNGVGLRENIPVVVMDGEFGKYARPCRTGEAVSNGDGYLLNMATAEMKIAEAADAIAVSTWDMPILVAGKIDVLLRRRDDPSRLAVLDHKTTSSIYKYTKNAKYDVQLPTYAYLIEHGKSQHGEAFTGKVEAVFYDLLHSKIPDPPKPLKSGKLSTARVGCPSWIYEQAISENNLLVEDYAETLAELRTNTDSKYFDIIRRDLFADDVDRCAGELYAVAKEIARRRIELAHTNATDSYGINSVAPRQPHQCILWGDCKYSDICLANNQFNVILSDEPLIRWLDEPTTITKTDTEASNG